MICFLSVRIVGACGIRVTRAARTIGDGTAVLTQGTLSAAGCAVH